MAIAIATATAEDVGALVALRLATAADLTAKHGRGHWSMRVTAKSVGRAVLSSQVLVAKDAGDIVGTVRLESKKPWAIDPKYFAPVSLPLYLHDLAVDPRAQRGGIGRRLVEAAREAARAWPAGAIRLDAYDHAAGAGPFYAKCGFREVGRVTYRRTPLVYYELLL